MEKQVKLRWRRNSGDNELTDDCYLWINGKPTDNLISQASGIYYTYINGKEEYLADSLKEGKEFILEELGLNFS